MSVLARLRLVLPGTAPEEHEVLVGAGAIAAAAGELERFCRGRTVFVLSTPEVRRLHGRRLEPTLSGASAVHQLEAPDGEAAKDLAVAGRLWREMLAAGGKRDSRVLAMGGGSLCDLAGFVAACFLRGIEVAQVPTTLLAQVDAAVGGKTAIDLPEGKNSVGAFHQPRLVVADTAVLATLDRGELASGLVEVIKMAVLLDLELLSRVEGDLERLLAADAEALAPVVAGAVAAKIAVVESDPREAGRRRLLNFGHTLGHALEASLGYRGLRHGEAVAWGMRFALRLALRRGLDPKAARRLEAVLGRLGLPPLPGGLRADELLAAMRRDKKAREGGLVWVLPRALGDGEMAADVPWWLVEEELGRLLAEAAGARG